MWSKIPFLKNTVVSVIITHTAGRVFLQGNCIAETALKQNSRSLPGCPIVGNHLCTNIKDSQINKWVNSSIL